MRTLIVPLGVVLIALSAASGTSAQQTGVERLRPEVFDVLPPSARVRGLPGQMSVQPRLCRTLPIAQTRRRMVDVAVQEWAFFGFRIVDRSDADDSMAPGDRTADADRGAPDGRRRRPRLPAGEAARLAASIAGYWAVTPEGPWIVERQNDSWSGPDGIAERWNAPWSAAFVSWVMCEAGLGESSQFQRAIAHHTYIDQAIRARDGQASQAAFVAYDSGEAVIAPGDLLCSSRRPAYRTIAERRRQMGEGARSHCDVVVQVDEKRERILAIGGNVGAVVSLKLLPAVRATGRALRPVDSGESERPIFAHLKLRADPIEANGLDTSPTIKALGCGAGSGTSAQRAIATVAAAGVMAARC